MVQNPHSKQIQVDVNNHFTMTETHIQTNTLTKMILTEILMINGYFCASPKCCFFTDFCSEQNYIVLPKFLFDHNCNTICLVYRMRQVHYEHKRIFFLYSHHRTIQCHFFCLFSLQLRLKCWFNDFLILKRNYFFNKT